jgi:hypothetical protein
LCFTKYSRATYPDHSFSGMFLHTQGCVHELLETSGTFQKFNNAPHSSTTFKTSSVSESPTIATL